MKKMLFAFALTTCLLLPSCCWNKCSTKKTTQTVEKEIDAQKACIRKVSVKEPAELEPSTKEIAEISFE